MSLDASKACCERRSTNDVLVTGAVSSATPERPPAKIRILFVDDEPSMIRVLKMALRSMSSEWEMEFAATGEEAIKILETRTFDVVVSDMRMPGINGAQLLNHILRKHPHTIRIILSGYSDLSEVVNCVGLTHQFLEKPCRLDDLKGCLRRVTEVKARLANDKLCALTGSLNSLPSVPELYLEIADALQSPTASAERIAEIAGKDPAISAKLLQLANSAFFGFSRKVFSVEEAVQLLGVGVIQSLAMAVPIFSSYSRGKCPSFPIDHVWEHSIQVAAIGRRIASADLDDPLLTEQAFCAGVLHDLGKIILADGLPDLYTAVLEEARKTQTPLHLVERKHFDTTHAEVGAYLLALWGLPIPLVEGVANHHAPRRCNIEGVCLAGAVHIANGIQHSQSSHPNIARSLVDVEYLRSLGLEQQYADWCIEFSSPSTNTAV